jgi:hypothetical protein
MANPEFLANLDKIGVAQVRMNLATKVYLGAERALAIAWLERHNEASNAEQLELARRASAEARRANKIAIIAVVVAIVSIIISIFIGIIGLRS